MVLYIIIRVLEEENVGEAILTEILAKRGISPNTEDIQSVRGQNNG